MKTFERFISRRIPLSDAHPRIRRGSFPNGGNLLSHISRDDAELLGEADPITAKYLRPIVSEENFLTEEPLWCLWLSGTTSAEIEELPELSRRVELVKEIRDSKNPLTAKMHTDSAEFQEN